MYVGAHTYVGDRITHNVESVYSLFIQDIHL